MFLNIMGGFIIPWLLGLIILKKKTGVIVTIVPIASLIAMVFNELGFYFKFWSFGPVTPSDESLSALPLDLGIYPVMACLMIFWIRTKRIRHVVSIGVITIATTLLEYAALLMGRVHYGNGWNAFYTFISYLAAYVIVYFYDRLLRKIMLA